MYLGVSIVAVYDFVEQAAVVLYKYVKKNQDAKKKKKTKKAALQNLLYEDERPVGYRTRYHSHDSPQHYEKRVEY
ncbi:hypothetical protein TNCV_2843881 [Trichonephila clavipes]|nr:hypothetical protein TNCV_2843881 [Trichonephila clavipes]